ncbi:hypothetical protein Tco_0851689 [Tanacetum coccineum]
MQEVVLFYNGLDVPTRQILDSRGAIPSKTVADAKVANSQKWHNGTSRTKSTETSDGLAAIQAQLNNLRREIKKVNEKVYVAQVGSEQCKGASISGMPLSTYLNLGLGKLAHTKLTVELADRTVKYPKGIAENVLVGIGRSLDPFFEDYIELNDLNVPLELRRDQVDDLMPTIAKSERSMIRRLYDCAYLLEVLLHDRFPVLEDMDDYCVEGMITIHNGNDEVTYQMVRSHLKFKNHTNEQGNRSRHFLMDLAERKEIDNVGGESTIWKSGSVGVLKSQDGCSTRSCS